MVISRLLLILTWRRKPDEVERGRLDELQLSTGNEVTLGRGILVYV